MLCFLLVFMSRLLHVRVGPSREGTSKGSSNKCSESAEQIYGTLNFHFAFAIFRIFCFCFRSEMRTFFNSAKNENKKKKCVPLLAQRVDVGW